MIKIKLISVNLPESYLKVLEILVSEGKFPNRSEAIRVGIRDLIRTEYLIEESLKALEDEFSNQFIRIHRNALVAQCMLHGLTKNHDSQACISFSEIDDLLEVSRRHLPFIRKKLKAP